MKRHLGFLLIIGSTPFTALAQRALDNASTPFGAEAVAAGELKDMTGQADTAQEVRAQNSSVVSSNTVNGQSQTGTINFDAGAFQAMAGLSLLSANTGNNVSINSSLNVNVSILPR